MSSSKKGGGGDAVQKTVLALANGIMAMSRDLESTPRRLSELVACLEPLTQSPVTAAPLMHAVARVRLRRIRIQHYTIWS